MPSRNSINIKRILPFEYANNASNMRRRVN